MQITTRNLVVDATAFAAFAVMTSTGVLIRYTLPPGSGRAREVLGMSRHDWGNVHAWTAAVFLGVLATHLVLHRKWISAMVRGRRSDASGMRALVGLFALLAFLALVLAPLVVPVVEVAPGEGVRHGVHP